MSLLAVKPEVKLGAVALLLVAGLGALVMLACGGPAFTFVAAGADGGSEDGGGVTDAGATDAAAGSFCAMSDAYDFCADFDESSLAAEWNNPLGIVGAATGAEDDAAWVSAPNSFLATTPPLAVADGGTPATARAILTQSASLPKGATHIAFDLRIDELDFPNASDPNASVVVMAYTQSYPQGAAYAVLLVFHPGAGGPFVAELVEATTTATSTTPTLKPTALPKLLTSVGVWYSVTLDFTITTALSVPASFGVTSGNPPTTSTQLLTLTPPLGTSLAPTRTLSVGAEATAAVGEAKIRFDNVTYQH